MGFSKYVGPSDSELSDIRDRSIKDGKVIIVNINDVRLMDKAHRSHFKLVQMKNANFGARLPLEKKMNKLIYGSKTILYEFPKGYRVVKDYGGNFFDGKLISYNIVVRTFGENINLFKLPRKAKKEYKKYGLDKN